jgi:hypothetical protein
MKQASAIGWRCFFERSGILTIAYRELTADGAELAKTEAGRQFLSYLINCALRPDQGAYAVVDGRRYDFPGDMGFAPDWLDRPLTETEQRWVSAGILALTNFFGEHVKICMCHPHSGFTSLDVSREEAEEYTLYEGDFFGNILAEPSVACVAAARRSAEQAADPIFAIRVGTEIDPAIPPILGRPITRCGFVLAGRTDEPDAHTFNGVLYDQYISVYLKPQSRLPPTA